MVRKLLGRGAYSQGNDDYFFHGTWIPLDCKLGLVRKKIGPKWRIGFLFFREGKGFAREYPPEN